MAPCEPANEIVDELSHETLKTFGAPFMRFFHPPGWERLNQYLFNASEI